jgi:uncharacterized protein
LLDIVSVLLLLVAGIAAGTVNTVVGSGSLITFPVLLSLGLPPVLANTTNNIGVLPGSLSGAFAYRHELAGERRTLAPLIAFSAGSAIVGAVLLLALPAAMFERVVPVLIALALVLVVAAPWLRAAVERRKARQPDRPSRGIPLKVSSSLISVYGGYFGAAQGVLQLASLSAMLPGSLQRANAFKNVLVGVSNAAAALVFVFFTDIDWAAAVVIGVGSTVGGHLGGTVGRRLPPTLHRAVIVVVGLFAIAHIYFG